MDIANINQFDPHYLNGVDLINHIKSIRAGNEPHPMVFDGMPTPNETYHPHEKIDLPLE